MCKSVSITVEVHLPDIEPNVLKELMTYIHMTESPSLKQHAKSLISG